MNAEDLAAALTCVVDKKLIYAAFVIEAECVMLGFEEGKTLYLSGDNLSIDLEAAN